MIHILWPTARIDVFTKTHQHWLDTASNVSKITTHVGLDADIDKTTIADEIKVVRYNGQSHGVAKVAYYMSSKLVADDSDIVILASDDMFSPINWDTWICENLTTPGALLVNDGYQFGGCVTLPIMTFSCLKMLNRIIYHPSYSHQYSDAELYDILCEMRLLRDMRAPCHPIFEHRHWACGKRQHDSVDVAACSAGGADNDNYLRRRRMPLQCKLSV